MSIRRSRARVLFAAPLSSLVALAPIALASCNGDTPPPKPRQSGDIIVRDAGAAESYAFVAKRPLAVVGLAEARGMSDELTKATVNRIADLLDACTTEQARGGAPAEGAARIVVKIAEGGAVLGTNLTVQLSGPTLAHALRCFEAPIKIMAFPPIDAGSRGFAVEAMWGRINRESNNER